MVVVIDVLLFVQVYGCCYWCFSTFLPLSCFSQMQYALAWGNMQMFNFHNRLQTDRHSLYLWSMPRGMDHLLNPIGVPSMFCLLNYFVHTFFCLCINRSTVIEHAC